MRALRRTSSSPRRSGRAEQGVQRAWPPPRCSRSDEPLDGLEQDLLVEAAVGYPTWLFRAIRHPVVWIGALLAWLDQRLNCDSAAESLRRAAGVLAIVILTIVVLLPTLVVQFIGMRVPGPGGLLVLLLLASRLFAQRSLFTHVALVAASLANDGLAAGREAVSHIVGRNPQSLDKAGVVRAAIESLAENFSDAVVVPALWCGLLGLPGLAVYKAINTADSMIGHRTLRHGAFGWAAARLDDLVNLPGSRLA